MANSAQAQTQIQSQNKAAISPARPGLLQRQCACGTHTGGGECESCKGKKDQLQRSAVSTKLVSGVPPIVHEVLSSPGQPLDKATRAFFEPRFGHDFSQVRVHTDARAATSSQAVNALAYTVGKNLVFGSGHYNPETPAGRFILGHELTHVVQQSQQTYSANQSLHLEDSASKEQEANRTGSLLNQNLKPGGSSHKSQLALMRLTPEEFRKQLGDTKDQEKALDALFADPTFLALWNYMRSCTAKPKQDLGPLQLKVTKGLKMGNVERFGGYFPGTKTLEINPTKAEHKTNPTELIDTVVHELIHAVDDLQADCKAAGSGDAPLKGAATSSHVEKLADVKGTPKEDQMLRDFGPGASNPCEEFIDINKAAQQMIVQILRNNLKVTKVGRPTLTFVNDALRKDPNALAEYKKCRDIACAKPDKADRDAEIAKCTEYIISNAVTTTPAAPRKP